MAAGLFGMNFGPNPQGQDAHRRRDDADEGERGAASAYPQEPDDPPDGALVDEEIDHATTALSVMEARGPSAAAAQLLSTVSGLVDALSSDRAELTAAREQRIKTDLENARLQAELRAERHLRERAEEELERLKTEIDERRRRAQAQLDRITSEASRGVRSDGKQVESRSESLRSGTTSGPAHTDTTAPAPYSDATTDLPTPPSVIGDPPRPAPEKRMHSPGAASSPPGAALGSSQSPPPPAPPQDVRRVVSDGEEHHAAELPPGWRYADDVRPERAGWWGLWRRRR
jgi:hypothetical protein